MIEPTLRKPAGVLLILGIIAVWAVLVASLSSFVATFAWPVEAAFYLIAGIAWIVPMGPILRWMETGRFGRLQERHGQSSR